MNALTRFESTTPVRYDVMNDMCTEVEARDTNLQEQINDLNQLKTVELLNGWQHTDGSTTFSLSRVGNTVTITDFFVTGVKTEPTVIFVLPEGCYPLKPFDIGLECYTDTPWQPTNMFFSFDSTNGYVSVRGNPTCTYVRFVCTFVCNWEG